MQWGAEVGGMQSTRKDVAGFRRQMGRDREVAFFVGFSMMNNTH